MVNDLDLLRLAWNTSLKQIDFDIAFSNNSHYTKRTAMKMFLSENGVFDDECSICGINTWEGRDIVLQLDHIDGNRHNNQVSNLRLLCPNCHSQTDTFSMRKKGTNSTSTKSDVEFIEAIKSSDNARQALIKLGLQSYGGNYDRIRKIKDLHSIDFSTKSSSRSPSREQLLDLVGKYSLQEVGEMYDVSGNAVRKWLRKYGIPSSRKAMRKFMVDNGLVYDVKWRISPNPKSGEDVSTSKLSEQNVRDIRTLHVSGHSQRSIAKQYHVSKGTIATIVNGKSWKHVK